MMKSINFHDCVDKNPNFVFILLMKNGYVISFYSQEPMEEKK